MSDYNEPMTARETMAMLVVLAFGFGSVGCGMGLAAIAGQLPLLLVIFFGGCAGLLILWTGCRMVIDRNRARLLERGGYVVELPRRSWRPLANVKRKLLGGGE